MNEQQQKALDNPCKLAVETVHPVFGYWLNENCTVKVTVNTGHE